MWWMGSWTHEPVPAIYMCIYINIVPPLGAFKSQLGGDIFFVAVVLYGLSLYFYIYIYISYFSFFVSFYCWCFCTSDACHIRIRNDCSEQVCDSCWIRQGGMNPSGNAFLSKVWMQRPDVWIYTFELVIRLSKVKQLAIFPGLTCRCRCVEQLAAVWLQSFFRSGQVLGHACRYCGSSFLVVGEVQLCT